MTRFVSSVTERNRGVAEARNTLLAQARGAFIAFFDDDDESAPDRLEQQYRRIVEYESTSSRGDSLLLLESGSRSGGRTGADV